MTKYIIRRILISIPVLIGITLITFMAYNLAPGDPISAMIDPSLPMSGEMMQKLRQEYGLDQPLPVRYLIWLREAVKGNLGYSFASRRPVWQVILERVPATIQLTLAALLIALALGIPLGVYSALHQYSKLDYVLTFLAFFAVSVPAFFFALGAIYIFSLRLDLFPTHGMSTPGAEYPFWDRIYHLILPATVLGIERIAGFLRYTRSSVLEVLGQDYMTTAHAKGSAEQDGVLDARLSELPAIADHDRRAEHPGLVRRRVHHRMDLRLARHGPACHRIHQCPRLSDPDGYGPDRFHPGADQQSVGRYLVCCGRPTHPVFVGTRSCSSGFKHLFDQA